MNEKEILIRYRLEQKFGKTFTVSMGELYEFIEDEIDAGAQEYEIENLMYKLYRDEFIDISSLKTVIEYLGSQLPIQMEYHGEKAKGIIRDLVQYCSSESVLMNRLFHEYQCGNFNIDIYRLCVTLMGYKLDPYFELMSDKQRKSITWIYDLDGNMVRIDSNEKKYMDAYNGILNLENTGLLVPSFHYYNNFDFITDYMQQKKVGNDKFKSAGLYRKYKSNLRSKGFTKKIDIFRMIITLELSSSLAKQFLSICGFAFDPFEENEMFILDYLNGKYEKQKTFKDFANLYNEKFVDSNKKSEYFEWPDWE